MKTIHIPGGKKRNDVEFICYKENYLVVNRKGCEFMRLLDVAPKKNFSYIFVQFPGMKMNVPMLSDEEGKVVKEDVALCVQINSKSKVNDLYLVRTQSIKPFDFSDEEVGPKALYRVIKKKETSPYSQMKESEDFVTFIADEVAIVQKKTEKGFHFILVVNNREVEIVASIEEECLQSEKESAQHKQEVSERKAIKNNSPKNIIVSLLRAKKKIFSGDYAFQSHGVLEPIRIILEDEKRKISLFSPAALDFIGPGDYNQPIFIMRGG